MARIEITPSTKVHDLLVDYPELENVLISMAPPFRKLKNPFLRKSIGKVTSLKQVSAVGKIPLNKLINDLRLAVGQKTSDEIYNEEEYFTDRPEWFNTDNIKISISEDKLKDKNKMTLVRIFEEARNVKKGEIIELTTSFLPAPGIDILRSKGYSVWVSKEEDNIIRSYFLKNKN